MRKGRRASHQVTPVSGPSRRVTVIAVTIGNRESGIGNRKREAAKRANTLGRVHLAARLHACYDSSADGGSRAGVRRYRAHCLTMMQDRTGFASARMRGKDANAQQSSTAEANSSGSGP